MDVIVEDLTLNYGTNVAVQDLTLKVGDGESLVLLGQSGCGKTSTMRCIAGLEEPNGGRISVGGYTVYEHGKVSVPSHKRNIGMVFQSYAVWPHKTVFQNVEFPLRMQRKPRAQIKSAVAEVLELVGLGHLADQNASKLSGGQMQRVALARSLAMRPGLLLLDEPLSNLDARLRDRLRVELRELQQRLGLTTIYVTHDQAEAISLADRIAVMQRGHIVQLGTPTELYERPVSAEIADFLGVTNIFPCTRLDSTTVRLVESGLVLRSAIVPEDDDIKVCIRPEDVIIESQDVDDAPEDWLSGVVDVAVFQGTSARFRVTVGADVVLDVTAPKSTLATIHRGSRVHLTIPPECLQVLPAVAS